MNSHKRLITAAVLIMAGSSHAVQIENKSSNDQLYYSIGGAGPLAGAANRNTNIPLVSAGVAWDIGSSCSGSFDPTVSVSNQLNGLTDGFSNMMGDMLKNATAAVAGLPGAILQRTNPELFDMMQNGVLQGKVDFSRAVKSCEDIQAMVLGQESSTESVVTAAKNQEWKEEMRNSTGDAISAKKDVDATGGDNGLPWLDGGHRGGAGQNPISAIAGTSAAGYNLLMNKPVTNTGAVAHTQGRGQPLWEYWSSPSVASNWVKDVVGEVNWRTCDGCRSVDSQPGKGLTYFYEKDVVDVSDKLGKLISGEQAINKATLDAISAPPGMMVREDVIRMLKLSSPSEQALLKQRLASEIAMIRTFEKGVFARRMLLTGQKEPNLQNITQVQKTVDKTVTELDKELESLVRESRMRKEIAGNTLQVLVAKADAEKSAELSQGGVAKKSDVEKFLGKQE